MKMLSRANVPTVEAGSFPLPKPQPAPRQATSHFLTPSDSASQIGLPTEGTTSYRTGPTDQAASSLSKYSGPLFHPQPAPVVQSVMPPPSYVPMTTDRDQDRQPVRLSNIGQWPNGQLPNNQTASSRSNISLSTATTLVMPANQSDGLRMAPSRGNVATSVQTGRSAREVDPLQIPQSVTTQLVDEQVRLGLPPKRELPFQKVVKHAVHEQRPQTEIDKERGLDNDDSQSVTSTVAKGKRKRGVPQKSTKTPGAKKPRATTTRKKAGANSAKNDTPVPTVEELLQQQGDHMRRRTGPEQKNSSVEVKQSRTHGDAAQSMEIPDSTDCSTGPRVGGDIADASPSLGGGCITRRITRSASKSLACVPVEQAREERTVEIVDQGLPCTPADQVVVPLTPDSPATDTNKSSMAAPALRCRETASNPTRFTRSHQTTLDLTEPEHIHPTGSFTCADPPPVQPSADSPQPNLEDLNYAQACLEADTEFAQGEQRLQAWTALPSATRVPALRSYFCRLIMDPGFPVLCKTLSSFWEREILERRIEEISGHADVARGEESETGV
ncbi:hypothetical protein A1O1_04407 [Capronia coronata CBS 617.96]|uniref:Uncharacterized protein n=1 Tax=Capronia coronata CBS 617.96 TaxID=1182541 RepID=W9YEJ6_9EURO|nr:uncharacterized protein A1O1_04407 [Capronia coronata CBS 617.96]EXJ91297.1 hypothetical protein A1O1_04407 [Capronia coronata CBS 617.96]